MTMRGCTNNSPDKGVENMRDGGQVQAGWRLVLVDAPRGIVDGVDGSRHDGVILVG
jgi:hypothetical protein